MNAFTWPQDFIGGSTTLFFSNQVLALQPSWPLVASDNLENPVPLGHFWFKTPCLSANVRSKAGLAPSSFFSMPPWDILTLKNYLFD